MNLQDYDTSVRHRATVVSSKAITPDTASAEVREILLDVNDDAFDMSVGQNVGILAPGRKEFGQDHHFRLYSIADLPERQSDGHLRLTICVRRCNYIDEYSGEEYRGVASNYLCDRRPGDTLTLTGPYGQAFEASDDPDAVLILIGAGTGIAPFRAFVKHLYNEKTDFNGRVVFFHGGRTGLDLLYMNDEVNDFALYVDQETFEAITALSDRPHWTDEIDWAGAIHSRGEEIWALLSNPHTRVYVAGLVSIRDSLDAVFSDLAGSAEKWALRKKELEASKRWVELLY